MAVAQASLSKLTYALASTHIHFCASHQVSSDNATAEAGGRGWTSKPASRVFRKDHMSQRMPDQDASTAGRHKSQGTTSGVWTFRGGRFWAEPMPVDPSSDGGARKK
jgi:hypothetical protein